MAQKTENLNLTQFTKNEEATKLFQTWSRDINCADEGNNDIKKIDDWAGEVNAFIEDAPIDYMSKGSLDNYNTTLGTKLQYTITKVFNPATQKYDFTITGDGPQEEAEAWAVGEINQVPVPPEHITYENNSKYYAEKAATYHVPILISRTEYDALVAAGEWIPNQTYDVYEDGTLTEE